MAEKAFLAWDLGAESGRALLGALTGERLQLHELERFSHAPVRLPTGYYWDLPGLWTRLLAGTRKAVAWCERQGMELVSLGVDTWGVDFGLLDARGELLGLPLAYRDPRHEAGMRAVLARIGADRLYGTTGLQPLPFNTLFQLAAMQRRGDSALSAAGRLLMMPDLFHYFLSGRMANEYTIASTTQMLEPAARTWAVPLLAELGIPATLLGAIVPPGTRLGPLLPAVVEETGAGQGVAVVAPASHDTASAVAAVPADARTSWAYLSSGTWSLLGAETTEPILTPEAAAFAFTHEGGVDGTLRFLKNIAGLWLVQECRRALERAGENYDYEALTGLAEAAEPFRTLLDPDDPRFLAPGGMPARIADYARQTGQPAPDTPGRLVRCCLESLALTYRLRLTQLEELVGRRIEVVHIVGGGGRNRLLNRMTADACARPVVVGPLEATAVGNLLVQARAAGEVGSLAEMRDLVARSVPLHRLTPAPSAAWDEALARFQALPRGGAA